MSSFREEETTRRRRAADSGRARRREMVAARLAKRVALLRRVLPWTVVALLAMATVAAGALAWRDATAPAPTPTPTEGAVPVSVERIIGGSDVSTGQPTGVALSGDRLYVADPRRGVVDVFTREGSRVATIGAGWLKTPVQVAIGPVDGRVYVSDRTRDAVVVFSATGERLRILRSDGTDAPPRSRPRPWRPLALAFAPDGMLYVSDVSGQQRIMVFSPTGSLVTSIGADLPPGRSGATLAFPNGIAATGDAVYVADSNNGRVLVLDRDGRYLSQITVDGLPRGVASATGGRMVVTDAAAAAVRAYGPDGREIAVSGGWGTEAGRFSAPNGVAVGEDGLIYIADAGNARVQVVRMPSAVPSTTPAPRRTPWWAIAAVALLLTTGASAWFSLRLVRSRLYSGGGEAL